MIKKVDTIILINFNKFFKINSHALFLNGFMNQILSFTSMIMRVDEYEGSQGVPCGRKVELYNPELFDEHEEVVIFTREEFNRTYESIMEHMNFINLRDIGLDRTED